MRKKYTSIIVTGSIAYDDIMDFPGKFVDFIQPDKLHQINVSFIVDKLEKQLGGTATNIAYNTRLLTNHPLKLLGAIGKDGEIFLNFLKRHAIDTTTILIDEHIYTSTGKAITDRDNNQIWGFYYGAGVRGQDIDLSKYADKDSLLIISANHKESFIHFQKEAIDLGIDYIYDPGMIITSLPVDLLKDGLLHARIFIGNDYEVSQIMRMTGQTVDELLKKGITVITTLGDKGVKYQDGQEEYTLASYPMKQVIDPTGAGDAWRGGFMSAYVEGKPILDCLKQGNAIASFAVEKYGTVNHSPSPEDVKERMLIIEVSNL